MSLGQISIPINLDRAPERKDDMATTNCWTLEIDFGQVGYRNQQQSFKLALDASPLQHLIEDAQNALRVYELLLIERPGDVWNYVFVVPQDVPKRVSAGIERLRKSAQPAYGLHPWPEGKIPLLAFDKLFGWCGDDTEPEDETWLSHRNSETMHAFARALLTSAKVAQQILAWNDHLLRHIVAQVKAGTHAYSFLDRTSLIKPCQLRTQTATTFSIGFYEKLGELLRDGDITSIALRANWDYRTLRMMATEQRRRAYLTGHLPGDALFLGALINGDVSNEAWDSEIWFFSEGLSHGDLFIQGAGMGGNSIKSLVESHHRIPGRYILSTKDEGSISGFDKCEEGDGFVLYRKERPDSRRHALAMIDHQRRSSRGMAMTFEDGNSIFGFEKALFVVGKDLPAATQTALASGLAEWRHGGGEPAVVSLGTSDALLQSGCESIILPDTEDGEVARGMIKSLLHDKCRWLDVVVLLNAPEWVEELLSYRLDRSGRPWQPWIVTNTPPWHLKADLLLEGNLAKIFANATEKAKADRPTML